MKQYPFQEGDWVAVQVILGQQAIFGVVRSVLAGEVTVDDFKGERWIFNKSGVRRAVSLRKPSGLLLIKEALKLES
jgi:hypothetical protein